MKWIRTAVLSAWAAAATAAGPDTFFAVHCEPTHVSYWPALVRMVALADSFDAKLTIEFNPQWADTILPDAALLAQVRGWQAVGHEVAAHHHGVSYGPSGWDGYTNRPPSEFPLAVRYRGDMQDYYDLLSRLAGDSLLTTCCAPDTVDWPVGIPYRTEGHDVGDCTGGFRPCFFNGQGVVQLQHGLMNSRTRLDTAKARYAAAAPGDICGLVQHEKDFDEDPAHLRLWLRFLQARGGTVKTVRSLMRERGYATGGIDLPAAGALEDFRISPVFPNPFNADAVVRFQARRPGRIRIDVFDAAGRQRERLADRRFPAGTHEVRVSAEAWPAGLYCIRFTGEGFVETRKAVLLK
ncbi:T9SS type A sorting domain-containing protein [bacterium]|nr:T9SS type A sorting domain-containing protein [bacterium]